MRRPRKPAPPAGSKVGKACAKVQGLRFYQPFHGGELTKLNKQRAQRRFRRRFDDATTGAEVIATVLGEQGP